MYIYIIHVCVCEGGRKKIESLYSWKEKETRIENGEEGRSKNIQTDK